MENEASVNTNNIDNMSTSQIRALDQARDITGQAMKDQIKFLADTLEKAQQELEARQLLIHTLESEKRDAQRKFSEIEVQNFEL